MSGCVIPASCLYSDVALASCDLPQPSFPSYCKVLPVLGNSTKTVWFSLTTPSRFPLSGLSVVHSLRSPLPHWRHFFFTDTPSYNSVLEIYIFPRVLVSHFFKNGPISLFPPFMSFSPLGRRWASEFSSNPK